MKIQEIEEMGKGRQENKKTQIHQPCVDTTKS